MTLRYAILKWLSIVISPFFLPLGVLIGLKMDGDNWLAAGWLLAVGCFLYLVDAIIFWKLIELNGGHNNKTVDQGTQSKVQK